MGEPPARTQQYLPPHGLLLWVIRNPARPEDAYPVIMPFQNGMATMSPAYLSALMRMAAKIPLGESRTWVQWMSNDAAARADEEWATSVLHETRTLPIRTQDDVRALEPVWGDLATMKESIPFVIARQPVWCVAHVDVTVHALKGLAYSGTLVNSPTSDCLAFFGEHVARTDCEHCTTCPCTGDASRAAGAAHTCPAGKTGTGVAHGVFPVEMLPDGVVPDVVE